LERSIGSIARWKAVEWSNANDTTKGKNTTQNYNPIVDVDGLEAILGVARWDPNEREREERKGLVYGLVVSGYGEGGVLPVESVMTSGTGKLRLTGSLGDVSSVARLMRTFHTKICVLIGHSREWRDCFELGESQCICIGDYELSIGGSIEAPAFYRHSSAPPQWRCQEGWAFSWRRIRLRLRLAVDWFDCPKVHCHDRRDNPQRSDYCRRRYQGKGLSNYDPVYSNLTYIFHLNRCLELTEKALRRSYSLERTERM
jgi:hypothetical protein